MRKQIPGPKKPAGYLTGTTDPTPKDTFFKKIMEIPVVMLIVTFLLAHPGDIVDYKKDFEYVASLNRWELGKRVFYRGTEYKDEQGQTLHLDVLAQVLLVKGHGRRYARSANSEPLELMECEGQGGSNLNNDIFNRNQIYEAAVLNHERGEYFYNQEYAQAVPTTTLAVWSGLEGYSPNELWVLVGGGEIPVIEYNWNPAQFHRDGHQVLINNCFVNLGPYTDPKLDIKLEDSNFVQRVKLLIRFLDILLDMRLSPDQKKALLKEYGIVGNTADKLEERLEMETRMGLVEWYNYNLVKDENGTLKDENGTLKNENGTLKSENGTLKNENGTLKSENGTLKNENGTLKNENNTLKTKVDTLEDKCDTLESENGTLKSELAKVKRELEEARKKNQK